MATLRIIGDVHGQIEPDDLISGVPRTYLDAIAGAEFSLQVGDMGDGQTYQQLRAHVDATRHRFFPGNHDHFGSFPPHCLGDFGPITLGGVELFYIRGAASADREQLIKTGLKVGKTLWFEQEELTDAEMRQVEQAYMKAKPTIVVSHDAPADMARFVSEYMERHRARHSPRMFRPSRTNEFLARLYSLHAPKLWLFGHHHRDWRHKEEVTQFICVGELSYVDIDETGKLLP